MAQNVTQYCHVCKSQTTSGLPVIERHHIQESGNELNYKPVLSGFSRVRGEKTRGQYKIVV